MQSRRLTRWFNAAVLAVLLTACSPRKPVQAPAPPKPLRNVPARQLRSVMHTSFFPDDKVTEAQLATDGSLHVETWRGKEVETDLFTDGEREFLLNAQGRYEEVHGDAAGVCAEWQKIFNRDIFKESEGQARLVGHEEVAGRPASIYSWARNESDHRRAWIAEDDFRLLRMEERLDEMAAHPSRKPMSQVTVSTYGYDPTVKVTFPPP